MLTKRKVFRIFDITEFLPGRPIPAEFEEESQSGGTFFFQPAWWCEEEGWGSFLGQRRGFPMIYSPAYPTAEAALEAANEWESTKDRWIFGAVWSEPRL